MTEQDKIKLKETLDKIKAIPKSKDMEKETDNLFPLIYELLKLVPRNGNVEQNEMFKKDYVKFCDIKSCDRIWKAMDYTSTNHSKDNKWNKYKEEKDKKK